MRLVIAAPANGALLKDALKAHLQNDPRVGSLVDLSSSDGTYPQLSFAAAQEVAAGRAELQPCYINYLERRDKRQACSLRWRCM